MPSVLDLDLLLDLDILLALDELLTDPRSSRNRSSEDGSGALGDGTMLVDGLLDLSGEYMGLGSSIDALSFRPLLLLLGLGVRKLSEVLPLFRLGGIRNESLLSTEF